MARILFYTAIRTRVKDQESLMAEFVRAGHTVFFVNQQPNKYLKEICKSTGVHYQSRIYTGYRKTILFVTYHLFGLIRNVINNRIDVVYSHLEPANFIAVLAQYFIKARVVIVRHHLDLAKQMGFGNDRSYKFTYAHARDIIAVSAAAKDYMIQHEHVTAAKIHHIDLGYDFKVFGSPNPKKIEEIKNSQRDKIILITIGRFDFCKRAWLSIQVCKELNARGTPCHLFLLGDGEQEAELKQSVEELGINSSVSFLGYVDNILDYLKSSDWVLHPSVSESSCVVIKEAALVECPVIVCDGVGDFNDYLVDSVNALLVDKNDFVKRTILHIEEYNTRSEERVRLGRQLRHTILERFDIARVVEEYDQFHRPE